MVATSGKGWRLAPSLVALVNEVDRIAPGRDKRSDGSLGDPAHRARKSDHNPDYGIVDAVDITNDPGAFNAHAHAQQLAGDTRISYIISNRQIWTPARSWQPYAGDNSHVSHIHVSVKNSGRYDTSSWFNGLIPPSAITLPPEDDDMAVVLVKGTGAEVWATDLLTRTYIPNEESLKAYQFILGLSGKPNGISVVSDAFINGIPRNIDDVGAVELTIDALS